MNHLFPVEEVIRGQWSLREQSSPGPRRWPTNLRIDDFLFVFYFRQVNLLLSEAIEALISFLFREYFRHEAVLSTQMTTSVQEMADQFEN